MIMNDLGITNLTTNNIGKNNNCNKIRFHLKRKYKIYNAIDFVIAKFFLK